VIRVGVFGAGGRMGAAVCEAVGAAADLELVAAVDPAHAGRGVPGTGLTIGAGPEALAEAGAEVAVDFTHRDAALANLRWCAEVGIHAVCGTTGLGDDDLEALASAFRRSNVLVAPNFAVGAVLMMRFAAEAARWFDTAEIVEIHHDGKLDAPSGTALATARRMAEAGGRFAPDPTRTVAAEGARGAEVSGVRVHALRLRGPVAHQEVILGTEGQTLTIRHDSYDRRAFMPGVLLAVRSVADRPGLTLGIDELLAP
jgi:4-hydroxy-tetrahydrodipicolinate reductase